MTNTFFANIPTEGSNARPVESPLYPTEQSVMGAENVVNSGVMGDGEGVIAFVIENTIEQISEVLSSGANEGNAQPFLTLINHALDQVGVLSGSNLVLSTLVTEVKEVISDVAAVLQTGTEVNLIPTLNAVSDALSDAIEGMGGQSHGVLPPILNEIFGTLEIAVNTLDSAGGDRVSVIQPLVEQTLNQVDSILVSMVERDGGVETVLPSILDAVDGTRISLHAEGGHTVNWAIEGLNALPQTIDSMVLQSPSSAVTGAGAEGAALFGPTVEMIHSPPHLADIHLPPITPGSASPYSVFGQAVYGLNNVAQRADATLVHPLETALGGATGDDTPLLGNTVDGSSSLSHPFGSTVAEGLGNNLDTMPHAFDGIDHGNNAPMEGESGLLSAVPAHVDDGALVNAATNSLSVTDGLDKPGMGILDGDAALLSTGGGEEGAFSLSLSSLTELLTPNFTIPNLSVELPFPMEMSMGASYANTGAEMQPPLSGVSSLADHALDLATDALSHGSSGGAIDAGMLFSGGVDADASAGAQADAAAVPHLENFSHSLLGGGHH